MPSNDSGVREITEPVEFAIVGDRLHFTLVSGPCERTYAISFSKAIDAATTAVRMVRAEAAAQNIAFLKAALPRHSRRSRSGDNF